MRCMRRGLIAFNRAAEAHYGKGCVLGMMAASKTRWQRIGPQCAAAEFSAAQVNLGVPCVTCIVDEALQQFAQAIDIDSPYSGRARTARKPIYCSVILHRAGASTNGAGSMAALRTVSTRPGYGRASNRLRARPY